jgi:hypothetical protein
VPSATIWRAIGTSTGAPGSMKPFCMSMMTCAVRAGSSVSKALRAPPREAARRSRIWV